MDSIIILHKYLRFYFSTLDKHLIRVIKIQQFSVIFSFGVNMDLALLNLAVTQGLLFEEWYEIKTIPDTKHLKQGA